MPIRPPAITPTEEINDLDEEVIIHCNALETASIRVTQRSNGVI